VISAGALTPVLVCFHKLEITPLSNFNHSRDGAQGHSSASSLRARPYPGAQSFARCDDVCGETRPKIDRDRAAQKNISQVVGTRLAKNKR